MAEKSNTNAARFNWKRKALRHFLLYALDMSIAIAGWTYGFGMEVKNWPALIGLMLLARWITSVCAGAAYFHDAKQQAAQSAEQGEM